MGVNFNEIDFVLSCNGKDLVNKEFQEDTENFVVTFVQKYYDFIYKENEKKIEIIIGILRYIKN